MGRRRVPGILADVNVEGHVGHLLGGLMDRRWAYVLDHIGFVAYTFEMLDLPINLPDDELWRTCQARNLVLVTRNRNAQGVNSLEAVIRREGGGEHLPVLTLADADRIYDDWNYRDRVAEKMVE